jgi:hypothetical protein
MIHILDETQITENYEKFRKLINQTFTGDRLDSLNKMYDQLEDRIVLTPASSTEHFHNAFAGGYIDHILRVTRNAVKVFDMYTDLGIGLVQFDKETVIFTALHHDLGKVGNVNESWYIPNDSQWHIENQGKIYKTNPNMHWMNLNDRTFWLLNHFGIKISEVEYLGIQITDGLYDEANKEYYISYDPNKALKSSFPFLMHQADIMATRFEWERWKKLKDGSVTTKNVGGRPTKKQKLENVKMPEKIDFKSIFGETTED